MLSEDLPSDPMAVGTSRRLLSRFLKAAELDELLEVGTLLVSELTTNAVLHATGRPQLHIVQTGRSVRVEVADTSPVLPRPRDYELDASTGRGLALVEALASAWGSAPTPDGKVVWFELGEPGPPRPDLPVMQPADGEGGTRVELIDLAPLILHAALEHGDAILRELAWLSTDDYAELAAPARQATPNLDLSGVLELAQQALDGGRRRIDATIWFGGGAGDAAMDRLGFIDEGERMAAEGHLLALPAVPELSQCRRWFLTEIARQESGEPPTAWMMGALDPKGSVQVLPVEDIDTYGAPDTVIIDTSNRIRFIGRDIAATLGWDTEELMGQRVTVLIPPEYREAHLVGFTRYQTFSQGRLIGQPTRLPALRQDGTTVPIILDIGVIRRRGSATLYRATLRPVDGSGRDET